MSATAPGGRVLVPVGKASQAQRLVLINKGILGAIRRHDMMPIRIVQLLSAFSKSRHAIRMA